MERQQQQEVVTVYQTYLNFINALVNMKKTKYKYKTEVAILFLSVWIMKKK